MNLVRRPIGVWVVSVLYFGVGATAFVVNFPKLMALQPDSIWVELTELLAVIAGVFLFRGQNWARWLAVAWMAFHVAISFPAVRLVVVHSILLALIAWALFRADSRRFFSAANRNDD